MVERGETNFQPERLGGTVQGKTLPRTPDYATTDVIVANPTDRGTLTVVQLIAILAHEYGHVLIGRLRAEVNSWPPPPTTGHQSPKEVAEIIAREAADEYRCDLFANELISILTVSVNDGEPEQLTLAWLDHRIGAKIGKPAELANRLQWTPTTVHRYGRTDSPPRRRPDAPGRRNSAIQLRQSGREPSQPPGEHLGAEYRPPREHLPARR